MKNANARGPLKIKFTPEQIAEFERQLTKVPGTNNSGGERLKTEGVLALQYQELETKRKELEILSRMEMRPTLKRKATTAEKLLGKNDEYKVQPQVVGMSGADPLLSFYVGGVGLNGLGAITKTGLWNIAKYVPTSLLGNYGRLYFVGNTFKNSFNGAVPTLTSQATSLLHPTEYNISDNITLYRANPTNIKNLSYKGERYGDTSGLYVGKWFTDKFSKPNWYASNMAKRGEEPAYYLVTVPKYWAKKQKASYKISNPNIEYEPEDYIIEDGIDGLQGLLYQGRPGTIQYLLLSFLTPIMKEPSTSLKFFERPSKISDVERAGVPKGDRNLPFKPKLPTEHVQGDEAVKMFKEYGGESIPEGSINGELLRKYVAEVRERYGLTNNKNITDEEIAQALYKHSKELGGNTAAINAQGEPQLLFRGDTRRYTLLKERMSPEELATKSGTMDNSLGNLFLGELPGTAGKRTRGLERYLVTGNEFLEKRLEGSGTGSRAVMPNGTFATEWGSTISEFPEGSYHLVTYNTKHGPNTYYKLPSSYSESGVNDINAFIVRTPQMRDASKEISVLNDDFMVKGGPKVEYHGPIRREVLDKDGFPLIVDENGNIVADRLAGSSDRQAMAQHYRYVLNNAKAKKQGLLKSKGETDGEPGNYLRDEHDDYSYFALPNFNIQGAKHLLPYDLRIPRNWKDKNIYRGLIPLTTGYTLYNLFNQPQQQLQYLKQGGKMNILEFLKNGSGIHIKEKNKGSFTRWCGGNVTEECIRRGKASSNPKIRKKATFADNVRHFKHKNGGFVKGVNVLDSNPKAYKYVKKKYKMNLKGGLIVKQFKLKRFFLEGGKFDWGQVALMAMLAYLLYQNDKQKNEAIDALINALKELSKVNKQKLFNQNYKRFLNQLLDNSLFGKSDLVNRALAYLLANNMDYDDSDVQLLIALLSSLKGYDVNGVGNLLGTFLNSGIFNKNNLTYNSSITAYNSGNVNKDLAGTSFIKPDSSNLKIKTNTGLNITVDDIRKINGV